MKRLLLGCTGQVGNDLMRLLPQSGLVALDREAANLADPVALQSALERERPDCIVNAAAYTAVDQAEREPDLARAVNAEAPGILARWAAENDAALVHYSTDYVFDGTATRPIAEQRAVAPLGVYGRSKLAGEEAIRAAGCRHLILRTSWVYSDRGRNFLRSILGAAQRGAPELTIVDDQWGSPTWSAALARQTVHALDRLTDASAWQRRGGTYHLSARGATTWCRFAEAFLDLAVARGLLAQRPPVRPIATADWPTPAARPAYSVLDNRRFEQVFETRVAPWQDQLRECMEGMSAI